jgi:hypothetical protein
VLLPQSSARRAQIAPHTRVSHSSKSVRPMTMRRRERGNGDLRARRRLACSLALYPLGASRPPTHARPPSRAWLAPCVHRVSGCVHASCGDSDKVCPATQFLFAHAHNAHVVYHRLFTVTWSQQLHRTSCRGLPATHHSPLNHSCGWADPLTRYHAHEQCSRLTARSTCLPGLSESVVPRQWVCCWSQGKSWQEACYVADGHG